jgi:gliding motility-associated-like protein
VIEALEAYPNFELTIFNRYGQKIYLANKSTQPWNGTLNNKPVPIGTYYFILDLKEGGLKRSGFVDIIR